VRTVSLFRVEQGTATLVCGQARIETRYLLHIDIGGRAVMVELVDRPDGMASDETVQLFLENGRVLQCQVLDNTSMCTIVGDGLRHSA
jgi:hypothetical protein